MKTIRALGQTALVASALFIVACGSSMTDPETTGPTESEIKSINGPGIGAPPVLCGKMGQPPCVNPPTKGACCDKTCPDGSTLFCQPGTPGQCSQCAAYIAAHNNCQCAPGPAACKSASDCAPGNKCVGGTCASDPQDCRLTGCGGPIDCNGNGSYFLTMACTSTDAGYQCTYSGKCCAINPADCPTSSSSSSGGTECGGEGASCSTTSDCCDGSSCDDGECTENGGGGGGGGGGSGGCNEDCNEVCTGTGSCFNGFCECGT